MQRRNIEIKARCDDLPRIRRLVEALPARVQGTLVQLDTYFYVSGGRLKLRETEGKPAQLIWYDRADDPSARASDYYLVPAPDPALLKLALTSALGVKGAVRKRRDLYLWHNVRIHLDEVEHLGSFIEFEAVISADTDEALSRAQLDELATRLQMADAAPIATSYSDLLGL